MLNQQRKNKMAIHREEERMAEDRGARKYAAGLQSEQDKADMMNKAESVAYRMSDEAYAKGREDQAGIGQVGAGQEPPQYGDPKVAAIQSAAEGMTNEAMNIIIQNQMNPQDGEAIFGLVNELMKRDVGEEKLAANPQIKGQLENLVVQMIGQELTQMKNAGMQGQGMQDRNSQMQQGQQPQAGLI